MSKHFVELDYILLLDALKQFKESDNLDLVKECYEMLIRRFRRFCMSVFNDLYLEKED